MLFLALTALPFACVQAPVLAQEQPGSTSSIPISGATGCQPNWEATFGGLPGVQGEARAFAIFDGGNGPQTYVGGMFSVIAGHEVPTLAVRSGNGWSQVGGGLSGGAPSLGDFVNALEVFDDGFGERLYVGGSFQNAGGVSARGIAAWDGQSWGELGLGLLGSQPPVVNALAVYDDGGGAKLYAGGRFSGADLFVANGLAAWDGQGWSPLGNGLNDTVRALAVFEGGTGARLYAAGDFAFAGGLPAAHVAAWDGQSWSPLGTGLRQAGQPAVGRALEVFDDGSGARLHVGGLFSLAGGQAAKGLAAWDGAGWSPWTTGVSGQTAEVFALRAFDANSGPQLVVGGAFDQVAGVAAQNIAAWDGQGWSGVGAGTLGRVSSLEVLPDASAEQLYAGGNFVAAGGQPALGIATWDGQAWQAIAGGFQATVEALAYHDDGSGARLYAGGSFIAAGTTPLARIGAWDGAGWSQLGAGMDLQVHALTSFDDGGGAKLYAGGAFTVAGGQAASRVAAWDGQAWSPLGAGVTGGGFLNRVSAFATFDDGGGPKLYVGGIFNMAGGAPANNIAAWDGQGWSTLGEGVGPGVSALAVYDGGGGARLFAGGNLAVAGGQPAQRIAAWDGVQWSPLGAGMNGNVLALHVHDDGAGARLFAGGNFTTANGLPASRIAAWDGQGWSALGSGLGQGGVSNVGVTTLATFDDGYGARLFAGGNLPESSLLEPIRHLARWDGATWSGIQPSVNAQLQTLLAAGQGAEASLYVGGSFRGSPAGDSYLARWHGCVAGTTLAGCFGNTGMLAGTNGPPLIGSDFEVELQAAGGVPVAAQLHAGVSGLDGNGCGLFVAGLGELLLALAPPPPALSGVLQGVGSVPFTVPVPSDPAFVGASLVLQAVHLPLSGAGTLELSQGLSVTFQTPVP